ncbi:MAG: hypothetical protein U5K54_04455 [Cytophagales bacterium]|nr:hypothetical protein [Cytophagales bacterium]
MDERGRVIRHRSPIELELNELTEEAKREKFYNDLKPQLDQIKTKLVDSHKNELLHDRDQIKQLLEKELCRALLFLKKVLSESGFKYDEEIKAAVSLLHNTTEYKSILKIQ